MTSNHDAHVHLPSAAYDRAEWEQPLRAGPSVSPWRSSTAPRRGAITKSAANEEGCGRLHSSRGTAAGGADGETVRLQ